jgi:hypothetical protein
MFGLRSRSRPRDSRTNLSGIARRNALSGSVARKRRLSFDAWFDHPLEFSLEARVLLSTIASTSGPYFYIDSKNAYSGNYLNSAYESYLLTNTDGKSYADVYAEITNFTGGNLSLAANASPIYNMGPVASGASQTAFFYISSVGTTGAPTTTPQSCTVTMYDGVPSLNKPIAAQDFTIVAVRDLIAAAANKITGASLSNANPVLGDTFNVILTGQTGVIGTNNNNAMYYTPSAFGNFPAASLKLISTSVQFTGGLTNTYSNTLLIPSADVAANTGAASYTATYTYKAIGTTSTVTDLSPIAYIASGSNNVKHNTLTSLGLPVIPIITGSVPTITTITIPDWTINQTYSQTLQSTGVRGHTPTFP